MIKLGVLCSGRGTDLQSIIDAIHKGFLAAQISIVLTDKPNVKALLSQFHHVDFVRHAD